MFNDLTDLAAKLQTFLLNQEPGFVFDFYTEANPRFTLYPHQLKAVQCGWLDVRQMPPTNPDRRPGAVIFTAGQFNTPSARLAAALSIEDQITPGSWLVAATTEPDEPDEPATIVKKGKRG